MTPISVPLSELLVLGLVTRLVLVLLATYGLVSSLAALVVAVSWQWGLAELRSPRRLATRLTVLRLAPSILGAVAAGLAGVAFVRFEPHAGAEAVGWPIVVLAALGSLLLLHGLGRALRTALATATLARRFRDARPVDLAGCPLDVRAVESAFPLVALVGTRRPYLVVAESVLESCSREELSVIVAHELAHLRARDTLRRAVFATSPDPLLWLVASRMEQAWHEASEQAADEAAVGGGARQRLSLASALVKIARMAEAQRPAPLASTALFRGEPVADRVRRLVSRRPDAAVASAPECSDVSLLGLFAGVATALALGYAVSQPAVFEAVEALVRLGRS